MEAVKGKNKGKMSVAIKTQPTTCSSESFELSHPNPRLFLLVCFYKFVL